MSLHISWRCFCAIEIPVTARELVLDHINRLRAAVPDAKASWSRDANIHLTLKFLGDIPQTSLSKLSDAATRAVAGLASFAIRIENTGVFPNQRQPRVMWIGINDSEQLKTLHVRLEDEAAKERFEREGRRFHPHLTIARLRPAEKARALAQAHQQMKFGPLEVAVEELLVIRSELSSAGSKYTVISRHPLGSPTSKVQGPKSGRRC